MPSTQKHDHYPVIAFKTDRAFEAWLARNVHKVEGIWLKIAKASSGLPSVTYPQAVETAICYGWIDGLRRSLDNSYYIQKFTPRRVNSIWSAINKKKVFELISKGRMKEAGLDAVAVAKKNGRWSTAYDSQKTIRVPPEFQAVLDQNPKAKRFFEKLNSQNRYAILFRITQAKKPETKMRRSLEFMEMLNRNETIYPQ